MSARSRAGRRRAGGGAAMVEALIVILAFILLDISLMYMHGAYNAKLKTMRAARSDVWQSGLKACQGGGGNDSGGGSDGSLSSMSGQVAQAKTIAQGQTLTKPLDGSLQTGSSSSSAQATGQATSAGSYDGLSLSTKSQLICNEKQQPIPQGDIQQTINSLYGSMLVTPWKNIATFVAVTGLGVVLGLTTRPLGTAHASTGPRAHSDPGAAAADDAAPRATLAPLSSARAIPAIVAALGAEDEVDDGAASAVPRPAGAKRLDFQALDATTLVTVYVANGAPADVFRGYSGVLAASGFVVEQDRGDVAAETTVAATKAGGSSVLVTLSTGETGTLLTLVETKPEATK